MTDKEDSNAPPSVLSYSELLEGSLDAGYKEQRLWQLRNFVERARRDGLSRSDIKEKLAAIWEHRPDELPWPAPAGVDYARTADSLIDEVWPTSNCFVGTVDQSEIHILVRHGGVLDNEPKGVDVALLGPNGDDGMIIEFLPMPSVDAETAENHRSGTISLIEMLTRDESHPWRYLVQRYCNGTANAYGPDRFLARWGLGPLRHIANPKPSLNGLLARQPPRSEGIGPLGRFVVYNKGDYVGVHLIRDERTIKAWLAGLNQDFVDVVLTQPLPGGCVRRTIFEPYEDGYLVDDDQVLNPYGLRVVVELIDEMYRVALVMEARIEDIREALNRVRLEIYDSRASIEPMQDEWLNAVRHAMPGPALDVEPAIFKSVLGEWVARELYGLSDPTRWGGM